MTADLTEHMARWKFPGIYEVRQCTSPVARDHPSILCLHEVTVKKSHLFPVYTSFIVLLKCTQRKPELIAIISPFVNPF